MNTETNAKELSEAEFEAAKSILDGISRQANHCAATSYLDLQKGIMLRKVNALLTVEGLNVLVKLSQEIKDKQEATQP